MKHTPDYVIPIEEDRTIPLLFNSWAIKHFCLEQGVKVDEMLGNYSSDQIDAIMLKGHESYCLYMDLPAPKVEEKERMEWLDALGGYNGKRTTEMMEIFFAKAMGKTLAEFREFMEIAKKDTAKKNSKKEAETAPNG